MSGPEKNEGFVFLILVSLYFWEKVFQLLFIPDLLFYNVVPKSWYVSQYAPESAHIF